LNNNVVIIVNNIIIMHKRINKELGFILKMEDKQGLWAKDYSSLYNGRAKIQLTHGTERWRLNPGFITKGFKQ